jgi:3-phenylpropionate/cinnamic acid dioxygenase small subunit
MADDYRDIENLLYRYAECIDDGDLESLAQLFAHGRISAAGQATPVCGASEVLALYRTSTRLYPDNGTPHTQHIVANPIIELDAGKREAQCRSRFTVLQATGELPLQVIIAGRYHDSLQKIDGKWHFTQRHMITELLGDLSHHLLFTQDQLHR